ncbi:MAG: SusC/RagA family TonB-linked outer membrane protein [Gemmatimonadaceae bacterium]
MYFRIPHRARASLPVVLATVGMFSAALALAPSAGAQTTDAQPSRRARVTGRVIDAATNQPLSAANIFLLGTPITATTGADGRFIIASAPAGIFTIEAKRLGYGAQRFENIRLRADSVTTLEFKLSDRPMMLDQVTVAGTIDPTSSSKSTFTVAKVDAADMPVPTTGSAAGMLAGKVAGVNITRSSGQPGSGVNIVLRTPIGGFDQAGGASGNGSVPGPLFIVDGVYLNSTQQVTTQDLDAMDVASIEVIKGAAAAALYGARAAAGVIVISTNRGKSLALGDTKFQFRTEFAQDYYQTELKKNQHHQFMQDAQGNWLDATGKIVPRFQRAIKPLGIMDAPYTSATYNNAKQLFKTGGYNTQTATVQGNFPASNYLVQYSRTASPGILRYNEGYKRQSIRVNVDSRPSEKLALGMSAGHSRGFDDSPAVTFDNFYRVDTDVNLLALDPFPKFGFPYIIVPDSVTNYTNPLYQSYVADNTTKRARTNLNVNGSYRPFSWLSLTAEGSYDRGDLQRTAYTARGTPTNSNGTLGTSTGSLTIETDITDGYTLKSAMSITKAFGGLTLRATDQGQFQRESNPFIQSQGTDFQTEGVRSMSQAKTKTVSQSFTDTRIINNITTLGASYSEKYILDFLVNREGNSRFGRSNRWNTFGRASGAWVVSEESWFPMQSFSQFKLRYSWGLAGFAPGFDQQYEALDSDGSGGITRSTQGNINIVPTKSEESELGLDATFKNRLQGSIVYVTNKTSDNFVAIPAPAVSGYCCVTANPGITTGNTIEATVQGQILSNSKGLQWSVLLTADKTRNRIGNFGRTCFVDVLKKACEGVRQGTMWGNRLVQDKANLLAKHAASGAQFDINDEGYVVAVGTGNTWRDGIAKNLWGTQVVVDGTSYPWGRPIVEVDKKTGVNWVGQIGDANPKLHYGLGNTFRYKGARLYFLAEGKWGGNVYNRSGQTYYTSGDAEIVDQFGKSDETKKSVAYYNALANGTSGYFQNFVETGTYMSLSEFTLGYTFDAKKFAFLKRGGISSAQVDLLGRNLATFTKYSGLNVAGGSAFSRIDNATYPLLRTWSVAVQLTF